ncbi:uncharacterized protein LAJ45_00149 [Morchella importuna]|uniref:uncharacterized protein n=1 Tax=Morchella importuna TaxID=1174673 RepID=UPI001E8DCB45|nr:uncharacterized protein LAJ45_00149 [Morchella importuna]KAH8155140.1 hypothetical protein LAJ45_00149 [Morchella importuna]
MSPSERTIHDLNITLNITRLRSELSALHSTLSRYRCWLHTIPAHKSYAPAYYAYLCRSYPSECAEPDYEKDAAEKALARVAEMEVEIVRLGALLGRYEAVLEESKRAVEEEERALMEGLKAYRAALEPLIRNGMEKQVVGTEKQVVGVEKKVLKMEQGPPDTEPEEVKAEGGEGQVDGEYEADDEGPFPGSGGWAGFLALPIW